MLQAGQAVAMDMQEGGYDGQVIVTIDLRDRAVFSTDWACGDPTRFPARIRAAAAALLTCRCDGRFEISHADGFLTIRAVWLFINSRFGGERFYLGRNRHEAVGHNTCFQDQSKRSHRMPRSFCVGTSLTPFEVCVYAGRKSGGAMQAPRSATEPAEGDARVSKHLVDLASTSASSCESLLISPIADLLFGPIPLWQ